MRRRTFLASVAAATMAPAWAATGATHLAAARDARGAFALYGLDAAAGLAFRVPLPGRGHAAAAHPRRAEAVAFARRPGTFALVIDCAAGRIVATLAAPPGRHFYGHGAYTADGARLLTTENAYDTGEGRIGIWDSTTWRRVGEIASGGIGPHEIVRLPAGGFAIANGGIRTHPDRGRTKLNLHTMRPNLSYLHGDTIIERVELPGLRHASIRHLAVRGDTIAMAMQWEGAETDPPAPLLALHRRTQRPRCLSAPAADQAVLRGYAGSVAVSGDGSRVAITGPRGGTAHVFDMDGGHVVQIVQRIDICGVAPSGAGFAFTDGLGGIRHPGGMRRHRLAWDNHLIAV